MNAPLRWAARTVLGVVVLTSPVGAATSKDAAREYNEKAKAAFDAGDFETAADQFTRALELFPEPRIRLNLGVAMENLGRLDDARDHYEARSPARTRPRRFSGSGPPASGPPWAE